MMRLIAFLAAILLSAISAHAQTIHGGLGKPQPNYYLGQVATGTFVPQTLNTNAQLMSRSPHHFRDNVTSLQVVFSNFLSPGNGNDSGPGNAASVTAAVEYPSGTCQQITFSSSTTGSIPNNGTLLSDAVSVTIPAGALAWIREWTNSAGGTDTVSFNIALDSTDGELVNAGATVTDSTWGAGNTCPTFTNNGTAPRRPLAIVAQTQLPNVCILGDSRAYGYPSPMSSTWPDIGDEAPSIGPTMAYLNLAAESDTSAAVTTSARWTNRGAMMQYCSNAIWAYGINDFGSSTAATVLANFATVRAANPTINWFSQTVSPHTTSTDDWETTVNQTSVAGSGLIPYNDALRAGGISGVSGNFDLTAATESSLDSGLWSVNGSAYGYTLDGLHTDLPGSMYQILWSYLHQPVRE